MSSPRVENKLELQAKITAKLAEALLLGKGVDPELANELAAEVEAEMATAIGVTNKEYTTKGRSLVFNLTKNNELRKRVLERQITPAKLVSANAKELAPEQIKMQRAQYFANRQVHGSERVVGWQAGTSGKLERSHKYEDEKIPTAAADTTASISEISHAEPDDTLLDKVSAGGAGIHLSGDPTEDAERVAAAMTRVREIAQSLS